MSSAGGGGSGAPSEGQALDLRWERGAWAGPLCSRKEDEVYRGRVTGKGGSENLWKLSCNCCFLSVSQEASSAAENRKTRF